MGVQRVLEFSELGCQAKGIGDEETQPCNHGVRIYELMCWVCERCVMSVCCGLFL